MSCIPFPVPSCRWGELQQCRVAMQQRSVRFSQHALRWTPGLQRSFRRGGLHWTSTMQHTTPLSEEPGVPAGRVDVWRRDGLQGWHRWEGVHYRGTLCTKMSSLVVLYPFDWLSHVTQNCKESPVQCGEFQWPCSSNTQCIPQAWRCDGSEDCRDGSDESGCEFLQFYQTETCWTQLWPQCKIRVL